MFFLKIKSFVRDYFTLTSRERKGALVLATIIILQIAILIHLNYIYPPDDTVITTYRLELEAFDKKTNALQAERDAMHQSKKNKKIVPEINAHFDPNVLTANEWMQLGLSQKQAAVILNYLGKGGRFRSKESVAKMYCITPELYQQMEPWIRIQPTQAVTEIKKDAYKKSDARSVQIIELNSADTVLLAELPMVGAGRARLIYKYREKLGGFISVKQLLEVFTIDSTTLEIMEPHIRLDVSRIRKINFNSDSLYHPYLNRKTASAIIAYRKHHGNFIDINALRNVTVLDEQMWRKVAPYAAFE